MSHLTTKSKAKKFVAGLLGLTMAFSFVFGGAIAPAQAATADELAAQINSLLATIASLQAQLSTVSGGSSSMASGYVFAQNLTVGSKNSDVMNLQKVLNMSSDTQVSVSGAGSPGNETSTFGPATKAAVIKFQIKNGISPTSGYVGPITRAKLNSMSGPVVVVPPGTGTGTGTVPPPSVGTGLSVSSATQPVASLAPTNAARLPFTKVTLTAGRDGDVAVNGITVERTGLSQDIVFSGIVLLDENGMQIGIAKTLNSNHQVVVGDPFTVKAGTSRTFTIAGNMASSLSSYAGQVATLTVVGVNTSATVSGSLPITGAAHTINASLSIGSVTMQRGGIDPGSSQTKEIGTTGYVFSSVRVTAGSAEDVTLRSIRWNQTGSAGAGDLANLKTWVDGVAYDTVASSDGKYYVASFGPGISLAKGFSKDLSIKGDVVGGSNRTIDFDLAKRTDLDVVGNLFGYGIIPPQTGSSVPTADTAAFSSSEDPWYDAAQVTVSNGTMNVSSNTAVASQNIAVNLSNQTLGGFSVEVRGEPITIASSVFTIASTTGSGTGLLTNVTLVNQNGAVIAGPVDATYTSALVQTVTFTDTVTYPVGTTQLTVKGKVATTIGNNGTYIVKTTPSSDWTTVKGVVTGNSITPAPASQLSASTMTVKSGALTVSVSSQPTARTIIAGANQFEFAQYILDASQSGEDVRVTSLPLYFDTTGTRTDLTNCQLYDASTSLTTGSNTKNPTSSDTASSTSLTFDGTGVVIAKGTSKTLSMKCNLKTGTSGSIYWWGIDAGQNSSFTGASGISSGQTIAETFNDANGQNMTASAGGSYTVSKDTSVLYKQAQAGASDVTLGALRFEAGTSENVVLKQVALALGNTASNSPADLVGQKATLWNGATYIGDAQFGLSSGDNATSTLITPVTVPKGESVTITVKGSLSVQNSSEGTPGAFLVVNYDGDNNGLNGNYATGADSGATVSGTSSDISTDGLRIFRSTPTVADVTTSTSLSAGSDLYAIKVTAGSGRDIGLRAMTFNVTSVGVGTVTGFQLFSDNGAVNGTGVGTTTGNLLRIKFDNTNVDRIITAGTSKTYRLRVTTFGTAPTAANTESVNIFLVADSAYATSTGSSAGGSLMGTVEGIELSGAGTGNSASTTDNFIWTPFSTTTSQATAAINSNVDWTNSYGVSGFPGVGQSFSTRTFKD